MNSERKYRLIAVLNDSQKNRFEETYRKTEESLGTNEKNHSHREILQAWMNLFQEINFGKESLRVIRTMNEKNNEFINDISTHECIFCCEVSWLYVPTPRGALCIDCAFLQALAMHKISDDLAAEFEKRGKTDEA